MRQLYVSALYMRRTTERIVVELETSDGTRGFGETNGTDEVLRQHRAHGDARSSARTRSIGCGCARQWPARPSVHATAWPTGRRSPVSTWRCSTGPAAISTCRYGNYLVALASGAISKLWRIFPHCCSTNRWTAVNCHDCSPIRRVCRRLVDHALHLHRDPGFTAFKMKCTGTSPAWDVAVLTALRDGARARCEAALGSECVVSAGAGRRFCANSSKELNLEYYEDPIHGIAGHGAASLAHDRHRSRPTCAW